MIDEFLKNELLINRESGTYLFYGGDSEKNYEVALEFAGNLLAKNSLEDKKNEIIDKVKKEIYSDLVILDSINIDAIRNIIKTTYTTSHEGGAKVFILKNVQNIRKESANAMLKVIEEPSKDNYFILTSEVLNILPTIKSRAIIYKVKKTSPKELGVDRYVYNFFLGASKDIIEYKNKEIDLQSEKSYKSIGGILKEFQENKSIEIKIDLYKSLRNFVQESYYLKDYEKIKFAEDIYNNISKDSYYLVINYLINLVKRNKNLKQKLEYRMMLKFPINMKLFFIKFVLSL